MSEIKSRRGFLKFLGGLVATTALPVEAVVPTPEPSVVPVEQTNVIREQVQELVRQDLADFTIECWICPRTDSAIYKKLTEKIGSKENQWTHLAVTSHDKEANVTVYLNGGVVEDFEEEAAMITAEICGNPSLDNLHNHEAKHRLVSHLAELKVMNRAVPPYGIKLAMT